MRLDKFLCDSKNLSRKESKEIIKKGRVIVNDNKITDPSFSIDESKDTVLLDSNQVKYEKFVYYMLNKPAGVVSATKDNIDKTVIDLFKEEGRDDLFPVGRLDKDTVGLLIVTNDGDLSHHLTSPKHHIEKTYFVKISNPLSDEDIKALESGIKIVDDVCKPAIVKVLSDNEIELTIFEGMFHQVKRMLKAVNNEVAFLKRVSIGDLRLDEELHEGKYRKLTDKELQILTREGGKI
ncbi:MAG: rRNA pseudouridine synthase [Lachnospiraceae bacterium]|nr:rRNA pseudouridine synthase [Lachnospiraceae bacterium]